MACSFIFIYGPSISQKKKQKKKNKKKNIKIKNALDSYALNHSLAESKVFSVPHIRIVDCYSASSGSRN